jgi:hypothetical protein
MALSEQLLSERIKSNLGLWSLSYRMIRGEPFSFKGHEYLWDIYSDNHHSKVIKKSAQVGASEYFINESFFKAEQGFNSLFVFPADPQLQDFSHGRVDTAIRESEYLSARVSGIDNVGLKQFGRGFVYFRGAQNTRKLKSIDADINFYDEIDEMPEGAVTLGEKRLGHSKLKWQRWASTPTVPDVGIDAYYDLSDKRRWHLKCEHCGEWQPLTFADNIDMEKALVVCRKCRKPIDRLAKGTWVAEHPDREVHGYHINKLFCERASIAELIVSSQQTRAFQIQEFYNSDLGETFVPEGGQITEEVLNSCKDSYLMPETAQRCTMGVDVGSYLNVRISKHHRGDIKQAVYIGRVRDFEELDILMKRYDVSMCVVDALPETRKAAEFCARWPGRAFRCYYLPSDVSRSEYFVVNHDDQKVTAHRTVAADYMTVRFKMRTNRLPVNAKDVEGYYDHMKAPARITKLDDKGLEYAVYVEGNKPDHYFHAEIYDELAFNIIKDLLKEIDTMPQSTVETAEEQGIEPVTIGQGEF